MITVLPATMTQDESRHVEIVGGTDVNNERLPREQWDAMTPDEQYNLACLMAFSADELHSLLALVPCPEHGPCIPHLRQWIRERLAERAQDVDD